MPPVQRWSLGNRPQLDGLRGAAVLLVIVGHTGVVAVHAAGGVGVSMFFALSGFLITALLLEERLRTARISLGSFYLRRACRLLPALFLFLASMGLLTLVSNKSTAPSGGDFLGAILYIGNYTGGMMQGHDNVIVHTWSLAVEEQFYTVWPLVVLLVLTRTKGRMGPLVGVAVLASAISIALRAILWDDGAGQVRIYYGTDTRTDCLLIGGLAAIWMHTRPPGRNRPFVAAILLSGIVLCSLAAGVFEFLVVPLLVPLLTVAVIMCVVQRAAASGFLTSSSLCLIGRRSYGIYLWHFPLFGAAVSLPTPVRWLALAIAAIVTAAMAHLSWRCVEEPVLGWKAKLSAAGSDGEAGGTTSPEQVSSRRSAH